MYIEKLLNLISNSDFHMIWLYSAFYWYLMYCFLMTFGVSSISIIITVSSSRSQLWDVAVVAQQDLEFLLDLSMAIRISYLGSGLAPTIMSFLMESTVQFILIQKVEVKLFLLLDVSILSNLQISYYSVLS